jgi:hypothetical protein
MIPFEPAVLLKPEIIRVTFFHAAVGENDQLGIGRQGPEPVGIPPRNVQDITLAGV